MRPLYWQLKAVSIGVSWVWRYKRTNGIMLIRTMFVIMVVTSMAVRFVDVSCRRMLPRLTFRWYVGSGLPRVAFAIESHELRVGVRANSSCCYSGTNDTAIHLQHQSVPDAFYLSPYPYECACRIYLCRVVIRNIMLNTDAQRRCSQLDKSPLMQPTTSHFPWHLKEFDFGRTSVTRFCKFCSRKPEHWAVR